MIPHSDIGPTKSSLDDTKKAGFKRPATVGACELHWSHCAGAAVSAMGLEPLGKPQDMASLIDLHQAYIDEA